MQNNFSLIKHKQSWWRRVCLFCAPSNNTNGIFLHLTHLCMPSENKRWNHIWIATQWNVRWGGKWSDLTVPAKRSSHSSSNNKEKNKRHQKQKQKNERCRSEIDSGRYWHGFNYYMKYASCAIFECVSICKILYCIALHWYWQIFISK